LDDSCIVLDIHLEGMNGLQLQQHLLKEGILIPIVFITADADHGIQTQAEKTGAFLLRKPFQGQQLIEAIDLAISNGRRPVP
jgi:FixJ family two-component response regulator